MDHVLRRSRSGLVLLAVAALIATLLPAAAANAQQPDLTDPRFDLPSGTDGNPTSVNTPVTPNRDAGIAKRNIELLASRDKPAYRGVAAAFNQSNINSDLAFFERDGTTYAVSGNYRGFGLYDVTDPADPKLTTVVDCVGGQGDVSVHEHLLFMSVEAAGGRIDCGAQGAGPLGTANPDRFRGIRIFDLSDLDDVRQVGLVQTCRGSHTHTLVPDLDDPAHVYLYNSGTAGVRSGAELAGCANPAQSSADFNDASSRWSIDIIKVPVANPAQAAIIDSPRLFRDATTGRIDGLWPGGNHGPGTQSTRVTDQCHDITVYPEIGLAAGACSGNGLLLDISDPAAPTRLDAVNDPNFAYWHSATFNNDGTKVVFTDEWGGGGAPRCRVTDPDNWGANAIFDIVDGTLEHRSYYKIPNVQSDREVCVAHNGNLVPVPGRDLMVQAWYEGGLSVFDFTDSANPQEVAFFDRGPYHPTLTHLGGYWSVYWQDGHIYGNEIFLGFDAFSLTAAGELTEHEIDAAGLARGDMGNPQTQHRLSWPASFPVARATLDQVVRDGHIAADTAARVRAFLDRAERFRSGPQKRAALAQLDAVTGQLRQEAQQAAAGERADDAAALTRLADQVGALADSMR